MRKALKERPVKGTTAAVTTLDESKENLEVLKIKYFSNLHNFRYEKAGLRTWKAYDIGPGKLIPWKSVYVKHQGPTNVSIQEGEGFFTTCKTRELSRSKGKERSTVQDDVEDQPSLFVCPEDGCTSNFDSFSDLELHIDVGLHEIERNNESLYDGLRRDWAAKFAGIDSYKSEVCNKPDESSHMSRKDSLSPLSMGWALKPKTVNSRFSENVRSYLTSKFDLGERTGRKADPDQVSSEMRAARSENGERRFERKEWLSKTQIAGFFSRLSASRKTCSARNAISLKEVEDEEDIEDVTREAERADLLTDIEEAIGLQHPIVYDNYDLCEYFKNDKIRNFNVVMLKDILKNFEITFKSNVRKPELVSLVGEVVKECECLQ